MVVCMCEYNMYSYVCMFQQIMKTSNADTPISKRYAKGADSEGDGDENYFMPLLTMDVWEHAYYLRYQNVRYARAWPGKAWCNLTRFCVLMLHYIALPCLALAITAVVQRIIYPCGVWVSMLLCSIMFVATLCACVCVSHVIRPCMVAWILVCLSPCRAFYVEAFMRHLINWEFVNGRLATAMTMNKRPETKKEAGEL